MRHSGFVSACALLIAVAACAGRGGQSGSASSPAPEATGAVTETPAAAASTAPLPAAATVAPSSEGTPVVVPTDTPEPNILSTANGTVLRSYSPPALDRMNDGNLGNAAHGIGVELPSDAKPPFVFTFELPAVAKISEFQAALRAAADPQGPAPSVTFAVSTSGADSGFSDVGTIDAAKKTLPADVQARWVRVTANQLFDSVGATGTIAAPPAGLVPTESTSGIMTPRRTARS
ncbi:MAG TPA: hypothetical protein VHS78_20140 [Candidatus Elarobacter sp.]|jgi:hypothetical protein|nr:hypothetical protein [Candidatus Elarobacter sp.]